MVLDPENIKRLQDFNKRLENPSKATHVQTKRTNPLKQSLHPIETEENPQQLFRELMKASANGDVPAHLMKRLKELEIKQRNAHPPSLKQGNKHNSNLPYTKTNEIHPSSELYTAFKMLLLEEEDDDEGGKSNN